MDWFVLRDLKRANAKLRAFDILTDRGLTVFTPMKTLTVRSAGRILTVRRPVIPDLLFVHEPREVLDPILTDIPTLQYRYLRGHAQFTAMTVPESQMDPFIRAVTAAEESQIRYYTPEEITPAMIGRRIRVIGGPMDGLEGPLLSVRGSRKRRLLLEIPSLLLATIELSPDLIQLLD